jgi:potassium efflux system protein
VRQVREALERAADEVEGREKSHDPMVLMEAFGDSAVIFDVSVWTDDPWTARRSLSNLHEAIWWELKDAGIVIAFPQLDLHLDSVVTESLQKLPKAS